MAEECQTSEVPQLSRADYAHMTLGDFEQFLPRGKKVLVPYIGRQVEAIVHEIHHCPSDQFDLSNQFDLVVLIDGAETTLDLFEVLIMNAIFSIPKSTEVPGLQDLGVVRDDVKTVITPALSEMVNLGTAEDTLSDTPDYIPDARFGAAPPSSPESGVGSVLESVSANWVMDRVGIVHALPPSTPKAVAPPTPVVSGEIYDPITDSSLIDKMSLEQLRIVYPMGSLFHTDEGLVGMIHAPIAKNDGVAMVQIAYPKSVNGQFSKLSDRVEYQVVEMPVADFLLDLKPIFDNVLALGAQPGVVLAELVISKSAKPVALAGVYLKAIPIGVSSSTAAMSQIEEGVRPTIQASDQGTNSIEERGGLFRIFSRFSRRAASFLP